MENRLNERITAFLAVNDGDGSGYGSGDGSGDGYGSGAGDGACDGYGDGYGSGYGSGDGYGYGYGDGYGSGSGSGSDYGYGSGSGDGSGYSSGSGDGDGDGSGISEFNSKRVTIIDGIPTIIESVIGNYAKGFILRKDFTLKPCYVVRGGNCFAHGDTLRKAFDDVFSKYLEAMPLAQRIAKFKEQFPDADRPIPARTLWEWHHILTGSCETGRNHFVREHQINLDKDSFTVRQFISLTLNSYGSTAIQCLADAYEKNI